MLETDCYLTIEPVYRGSTLRGIKVEKVTQTRPRVAADADARVVKLHVKIPRSTFEPYRAELEIPEEDRGALVEVQYDDRFEEGRDGDGQPDQ